MSRYIAVLYLLLLFSVISCKEEKRKGEVPLQATRSSLLELCPKYGTDKCADRHNFIEIYDELFTPIRDSASAVLEIGILNARSHLMWQEYFQSATIYGIDINDCSRYDSLGIHTFIADQSDREDLNGFIEEYPGPYDIIIDDGGHNMDQQQISLGYFFKYLNSGGIYIIEDLHTSIPFYYHSYDGFGVNEDSSNTTLNMINTYINTNKVISEYLSKNEVEYLENNIDRVTINRRNNPHKSMLGIFYKR